MPSQLLTESGTRRLSDVAKHLVLPDGIVATGYPAVAAQLQRMGESHDDWQVGLCRAVLAKRETGLYAAGIGGVFLSTCRQVGKTFTFGTMLFALCILNPGTVILWTAHHSRTADETFDSLAGIARRTKIKPYVPRILGGNGKQTIEFSNKSRILFGAREHGFGRGIPGVSVVVFDEAQILTPRAVRDMVPATNTIRNPLIIYMGTPPEPDDQGRAEVFKARRRTALELEARVSDGEVVPNNTLYVELGGDPEADRSDPVQRAKANPSYPYRTSDEAFDRLVEQLKFDDGAIRREAFGIWDEESTSVSAITSQQWEDLYVDERPTEGNQALGVAFSLDGTRLSLAGAIAPDGAAAHAELIDAYAGSMDAGLGPLADWMAARWRDYAGFVLSGRAGASVLAELLRKRKVPDRRVIVANTPVYLQSCVGYLDEVRTGSVTHLRSEGQTALDLAVAVTNKRSRSRVDDAWSWWAADGSHVHVEAVSLALYGARHLHSPSKQRDPSKPRGAIL